MIRSCRKSVRTIVLATTLFLMACAVSSSQTQVLVETPYQRIGDSFYENFGVGWNYSNDNFFVNVPNGVRPPFGLGDPNADARLGFSMNGPGGGRFGLNLTMGQGSTRTNSVTTPMVMVPNGGYGAIFDGSVRPFVTGFIPVVGGGFGGGGFGGGGFNGFGGSQPYASMQTMAPAPARSVSPLQLKLERMAVEGRSLAGELAAAGAQSAPAGDEASRRVPNSPAASSSPARKNSRSSAEQGDISVAEIRRRQAAEESGENALFAVAEREAIAHEAAGKIYSARQSFKRAAEKAPAEHRERLVDEYHRVSRLIDKKSGR